MFLVLGGLFLFLFFYGKSIRFYAPESAALYSNNMELMSARTASDDQWRFHVPDSIPLKFEKALLAFEDKRFYKHPGIDPIAMARAALSNIRAKKIVSGGSTLTMQLIRITKGPVKRTIGAKLHEMIGALALELHYSKKELLRFYAAHAPFGGNVVGLEAASWRWFGRAPADLSWAEAATLAVLPNAPSLIHLTKNHELLRTKRNKLLDKLFAQHIIDELSWELAKAEEIPLNAIPLPDKAPHLLEFLRKQNGDHAFHSDLDAEIQLLAGKLIAQQHAKLQANQIHNLAALVLETRTGKILAYHGNVGCSDNTHDCHNDMIQALRSSGSLLKPFLYAAALEQGLIYPTTLLADIPSWIGGYSPKNFNERYAGAVAADIALQQSLNIPFVMLLKQYGVERFHQLLAQMGLSTFSKNPAHYGLSLILGGGEISLFEITEAYRKMGAQLSETDAVDFPIEKGAIWLTTETLTALNRPETESGWYDHGNGIKIAWKTGTSFGFRDAWAVGFTPEFTIGVWAGNADGTGRPGLIGTTAAAPLLFDLAANLIKSDRWFEQPLDHLEKMDVCAESGFSVGLNCPVKEIIVPAHTIEKVSPCKYHHQVRTTADMAYRIPADCDTRENSIVATCFVLPPLMAHYYKQKQLSYRSLPPLFPGCKGENGQMEIIFPPPDAAIYQPLDFNGEPKAVIFELTHTHQHATVFWHLDDTYVGATEGDLHQMPFVFNRSGNYRLSVTDMDGQSLFRSFNVQLRE